MGNKYCEVLWFDEYILLIHLVLKQLTLFRKLSIELGSLVVSFCYTCSLTLIVQSVGPPQTSALALLR